MGRRRAGERGDDSERHSERADAASASSGDPGAVRALSGYERERLPMYNSFLCLQQTRAF